ncbi:hypothetical protein TNCT_336051 [Trichonephila clavata]|uniref:Uncharacterized protein n=1 Tax=Trichonephila clavata TaxID=2740835 RepID=A0A8X6LGC1_TRICU|nr:hypothetical protein TNCT_336051 [Trichonephila clavata]
MSVPIVEDYPRLMGNLSCLIRLYAPAVKTESLKPRDHIVLVDLILRTLTERKNNENLRLPQLQNQLADTVVRHFGFRISNIINSYKTECENVQKEIAEKKAYIKATIPQNERLKKEVEELRVTLDMFENTDRQERIRQQLYAKEPHFDRCFSKREHLRLLAENAPLQKKVDEINRRLLEVEEQCMKDIVNESQWIDIFPPGFESSLVKLLPRINVWSIPRQHFNDLAVRLAEILKRIHIKRSEDWIALQNFINDINPRITLLMQDVEERKQYLDDLDAEVIPFFPLLSFLN